MRAVAVHASGAVRMEERAAPHPSPGEVVVDVAVVGLCATDRKLAARGADPPRVPGHEVAGTLVDGRSVVVHPDTSCHRCAWCRRGWTNRCPERRAIGLDRDGGLADRVVVPESHVLPATDLAPEIAALLEPLACTVQAVDLLEVQAGEVALVVGAGAMGVLAMWALQAAGARVVVAQRSAPRREQARQLGADAVVAPADASADVLGAAPSAAIVTAPGSEALRWALAQVAGGGRVHAFAGTPGGSSVDANLVHYRHLTLVGSTGSRVRDLARARDLALHGRVPLARLPVERVTLADAPAALQNRPEPPALKTIVTVRAAAADRRAA